jgi:hypothetical protein
MHLWIDNTGLHGAGRCLVGEAKTHYDVKGLLQLATLLVFAEKIELNSFEPSEITEASKHFRSLIVAAGADGDSLVIRETSKERYEDACRAAADFASEELIYRFNPDEQLILGVPQANIPRGAQFQAERTEDLARETDASTLESVRQTALESRAGGAVEFMLATSSDLRNAIVEIMDYYSDWSPGHTFQIESMLRAYLNENLAEQINASYAPAIHRANVIFHQNQWILDKLGNEIHPVVEELRGEPLGIPSVIAALIDQSKGDPRGLLAEALKLRRKSGELRAALSELQAKASGSDGAARHKVQDEVKDLARGVRIDLGLESLWDAIKLEVSLGSAKLSSPLTALLDWAQLRYQKGKRVALTDAARNAAFSQVDETMLRRLFDRSCRQKPSLTAFQLLRLQ